MTQEAKTPGLIDPDKTYLVQTDDWIQLPGGGQSKAIWGRVVVIPAEDLLGLRPKNSANWYLQVGFDDGLVLIAGCRIHYALECAQQPPNGDVYTPPSERFPHALPR